MSQVPRRMPPLSTHPLLARVESVCLSQGWLRDITSGLTKIGNCCDASNRKRRSCLNAVSGYLAGLPGKIAFWSIC